MAGPTIVSLINDYVTALKRWLSDVSALGKVEMSEQGKRAGIGAGLLVGAALFALTAFGLVAFTLVYILVAVGLPAWASFAVVAVLYLVVAAILALIGKNQLSALKGPQRTIAAVKAGPGIPLGGAEEPGTTPLP